jgi:hypothetical protein
MEPHPYSVLLLRWAVVAVELGELVMDYQVDVAAAALWTGVLVAQEQ